MLTKGGVLKRFNIKTTKQAIRAAREGFSLGVITTKKTVKEVQTALIESIEGSGLSLKDKGKFLRTLKNIQTIEQLHKKLPVLKSRFINALEKERRSNLLSALKKTLAKTAAKKDKQGKFDVDSQVKLDLARSILKLNKDVAAERLEIARFNPLPSMDDAFTNRLLAIAARDENLINDDIEDMLFDLTLLKEVGKNEAKIRIFGKRIKAQSAANEYILAVSRGKKVVLSNVGFAKRAKQFALDAGSIINSTWRDWDTILDVTINKKGVEAKQLISSLRMSRQFQAVNKQVIEWEKNLTSLGMRAYGFQTQEQLIRKWHDDSVRHTIGEGYKNRRGEVVDLAYSKLEAIKFYMERLDPSITEVFTAQEGNAFTEDMVADIIRILDKKDKDFAIGMLSLYREMYKDVNEVYSRMYGVNLKFNEVFSPILRDKGDVELHLPSQINNIITDEMVFRRSLPTSLKSRIPNSIPIERRDAIGSMYKYMHDMSHFIHTAEQTQFLDAVFRDARLVKNIKAFHGTSMTKQINAFLQHFGTGYVSIGTVAESVVGRFNRNFARSVLGLKATIGAKQVTSYFKIHLLCNLEEAVWILN